MTATVVKLAFAGIRSRLLASALTILLSSAATATIVLALEVGQTARDPWQRTFDAANGAHVLAAVPSPADARTIATLPGVAERDEPVPSAIARVASGGGTERVRLAGLRSPARPNPIAMSVVKLVGVEGTGLSVVGLDCLDDTPLIDIKPYFASTDAFADAVVGWHQARKA